MDIGSTGKPKGVQHGTAGYLLQAAMTHKYVFDYHDGDIYWCTADVGWVTGHSYIVYGPLINGATTLMFEGVPNYPDPSRFWQVIDKHSVNIFYTAPTAIRSLMASGVDHVLAYSLHSLKALGSVGEPINEEAWHWYHTHVGKGRCPLIDTWWQTETGAIMISPLPGITTAIVDEAGNDMPNGSGGILVVKRPWPSMIRTIWNDPERFKKSYFPEELKGYYLAGDGAVRSMSVISATMKGWEMVWP